MSVDVWIICSWFDCGSSACRCPTSVPELNQHMKTLYFLYFQLNLCTSSSSHPHFSSGGGLRWCSDNTLRVFLEGIHPAKNQQFEVNEKAILQREKQLRGVLISSKAYSRPPPPLPLPLLLLRWSVLSPHISSASQPQVGPGEGGWILKSQAARTCRCRQM